MLEKDENNTNAISEDSKSEVNEVTELSLAVGTLISAMHADFEYLWAWHCNIAMSMVDEGVDQLTANRGAARFLNILTTGAMGSGIDITQSERYKQLVEELSKQQDGTDA